MRSTTCAKMEIAASAKDAAAKAGRREAIEGASSELMGVLTLVHAAYDLSSTDGNLVDVGLLTSPESRLNELLLMTRERVVKAMHLLDQAQAAA